MDNKKTAVITGIRGQDASYLAELLLFRKGYKVIGVCRRTSNPDFVNIQHLLNNENFEVINGDVGDAASMIAIASQYQPDEWYNLAAQSFVAASWTEPAATFQTNAMGVLNCLEAIRQVSPTTKFYQASTSEVYGDVLETPQSEETPTNPVSPYAAAKCAAEDLVKVYRESYNLYACYGRLFNHETLSYSMPLIFKYEDGFINILPIGDIARNHTGVEFDLSKKEYQEGRPTRKIKVWDKNGWTDIKWVSGYPHKGDKNPRIINARNFVYMGTGSHVCIMDDDSEKPTKDLQPGDRIKNIEYPDSKEFYDMSLEEAELLGMMVGDGNLQSKKVLRFTNKDKDIKDRFIYLWNMIAKNIDVSERISFSGFNKEEKIGQVICSGEYNFSNMDIYTEDINVFGHKNKKVPFRILNAKKDVMEAFLIGYNSCDGLKSNPCKYRFKNFKTNSPTLAAGLLFLVSKVTGQKYNITVEESYQWDKKQHYYSINLLSDNKDSIDKYNEIKPLIDSGLSQREINRQTGVCRDFIRKVQNGYVPSGIHHLEKCNNEIKKIIDFPDYNGWFFDLETSTGTFHAGIGQGVVHNSERRGVEFVTRKITHYIGSLYQTVKNNETKILSQMNTPALSFPDLARAAIKRGIIEPLHLGNLDAKRDWSHASDMVEGMWLMLNQDKPGDYVLASGKTRSIREFLFVAFRNIGIDDWDDFIVVDPKFYRPAEVNLLLGDATKARSELKWEPLVSFEELVNCMVTNDCHEDPSEYIMRVNELSETIKHEQ